jgi:hypothetical protein
MRLPRLFRRIIWPLTALLVLVVGVWLLLLSPPVLTILAGVALARATGVPVQVERAAWDGWGTLTAESVTVTAPGWGDPADRLLEIKGFSSAFRPLDLLIGRITIEDLQMREATLRLAQRDLPDGTHLFNLSSLTPSSGGFGPSVALRPSKIHIGVLRVENLAYAVRSNPGGSESLVSRITRGFRVSMQHKPDAGPHQMTFELVELEETDLASQPAARDRADGLRIDGEWNEVTFAYEVRIPGIDFGTSIRPLLPLVYGQGWDRLGVKGRVSDLQIRGDPQRPIREARLSLTDAAINLADFGLRQDWWRFREGRIEDAAGLPRMAVDRGTVLFHDDQLTLKDFAGRLLSVVPVERMGPFLTDPREVAVPLPATLSLSLDFRQTPPPATMEDAERWFLQAIDHAGFDLEASVPDFTLRNDRDGKAWVVELPRVVVNILDNFSVRQGSLAIMVKANRPPSPVGSPAPDPRLTGSLRIREGEGAYVNFNYPLTGVDAQIEFEDDQVLVRQLKAVGSSGCGILISGRVDGAEDDAGVDLQVQTVSPAPIDEALQNAFQPGPRRIFELLFAREMRQNLVDSGLLPDQGTQLGGTCRFDIRVHRPRGGGDLVETTGTISVQDAKVLCNRFPYPIDVQEGLIQLEDERIVLPKGHWRFTTAGSGEGTIHGQVRIPRGRDGRDALPDLQLLVAHDRINPLLMAALPLDSWNTAGQGNQDWPGRRRSEIARAMQALGMQGELAVSGAIGSGPTGDTTLDLDVFLTDGSFTPREGPDRLLETSGLPWPAGFDMDRVTARARVTERSAWLPWLKGRVGEGRVEAEGGADMRRRDRWLRARLDDVPLGLWLPRMLPDAFQAAATEAWEACRVRGAFDADIVLTQPAEGPEMRRATFTTPGIDLEADGQPCRIELGCGHLVIEGPTLDLIDVEIDASQAGRHLATIRGDGAIALGALGRQDLQAEWRIDSLASPLLPTILRAGGLDAVAEVCERWNPAGSASGRLHLGHAEGDRRRPDWGVEIEGPFDLYGDPGGVSTHLSLGEGAELRLSPGRVLVHDPLGGRPLPLRARVTCGTFAVGGALSIGPEASNTEDMTLRFDLSPLHPSLSGILPEGLAESLRTINLTAESAIATDLRLLGWSSENPSVGVAGTIRLDDGAMDAGVHLDSIHADFGVLARPSRPDPVRIGLGLGDGSFLVRGRLIERVDGLLHVGSGGGPTRIERLEGSLYGGRVLCDAIVDPAEDHWSVRIAFDGSDLAGLVRGGEASPGIGATGSVRGAIALEGGFSAGTPATGIGRVQATQARMGELPLTLRMLQASQLMLPLADSLDTADIRFHLRGPDLRFERFDLTCPTLKLLGHGSLDLRTWDVAMRFRNRGTVPLISDLFGAASDQLFVIDVSGSASDPDVRLTPLPPLGEDPSTRTPRPPEVAKRENP